MSVKELAKRYMLFIISLFMSGDFFDFFLNVSPAILFSQKSHFFLLFYEEK